MGYRDASVTSIGSSYEFLFNDDANRMHAQRLSAYRRFWLYYLGRHWSFLRDPGDSSLTLNYCRRIVDLHSNFVFGKGFKVAIPDIPSTKVDEREEREFIRLKLEETWCRNSRELWGAEAGQMGGVTGDVFVRVSWDKDHLLEEPYARADIIPSHLCFPEFCGPHGVDRKKIKRILILNPVYEDSKDLIVKSGMFFSTAYKSKPSQRIIIEGEQWVAAEYGKDGKQTSPSRIIRTSGKDIISDEVNQLGEIPVVHIANLPLAGEYYGLSDLLDASELNREMNEKTTDISDVINYHGSPMTILTGAKLADLERGANRIWALPDGATVSNLGLSGDLGAANTHLKSLKDTLLELTNTPEQAIGARSSISNTSGVALQLQYFPMMEKRNIKIMNYGNGIRLINRLFIRFNEIADPIFKEKMDTLKGNKYRNQVVFPDPLPVDEVRDLEISRTKLDLGLTTKRKELAKAGFSQSEIEEIIEESLKEMAEEQEAMFEASGEAEPEEVFDASPGKGKATLERGGPRELRGEKIARTRAKEQ